MSPRREIEVMARDRSEDEAEDVDPEVLERFSADSDTRWLKKGRRCHFGHMSFLRVDGNGFCERVMTLPANASEMPHLAAMTADCRPGCWVLADKGCASAANREPLAAG